MADGPNLNEEKDVVTSSLPFSNSDKDVIDRQLDVSSVKTASLDRLVDVYDIDKSVDLITKRGYENIALQFPDSLLSDAASIAALLEQRTNAKTFILADTSYGSCCVDEVAAEHIKADLIIHYGRACLSPTRRVPVLYVFGKQTIGITKCIQHFKNHFQEHSNVIIMYDVVYSHSIESLETRLKEVYNNLVVSKIESTLRNEVISKPETNKANVLNEISGDKSSKENSENDEKPNQDIPFNQDITERKTSEIEEENNKETDQWIRRFGHAFKIPRDCKIDEYKVFYIGEQSLNLTNLIMTYNKCQFYTYNPATDICQQETLNINRALMKRYYMIQKAKDAQVVGIVVGTLGVANYLDIIERLKKVLTLAGKKFYTFVMGKLNVPKMANFMEIDVFVLVACPENTLIDSQEFFKPIVTPYEMEIACLRTQEWTGEYVTDFRQLLPGASFSVDIDDKENVVDDEDCPDMSLITGQLRTNYKATTNMTGPDSTSVAERNKDTTISTQRHTTGAEFLASRSWKGLEQNLGQTTVSKTKQGRMGRASGYTHEENH